MSRDEARKKMRRESTAAGDVKFELEQLKRLQELQADNRVQGIETITVTCGRVLTFICC